MPKKRSGRPPDNHDESREGEVETAIALDGRRVDLIRRGGRLVPCYQPLRWSAGITIEDEIEDSSHAEGQHADVGTPDAGFSHFGWTTIRPSPGMNARLKRGQHLRQSDAWEWEFRGPSLDVRWIETQFYSVVAGFRKALPERDRALERWIALHFIARTSPYCTRSARGDMLPGPPPRCLAGVAYERLATILSKDLRVHDAVRVERVIDCYLELRGALQTASVQPERARKALGLHADPLPPPAPELTADEAIEMQGLEARCFKHELDPVGQDRLLALLNQHIAYLRNKLAGKIGPSKPAL